MIKIKTKKNSVRKESGFTLLEILLVVALTGTVFVAVFGLFSKTIKSDTENAMEVVAANLAQEGIEIIRNKRDENLLQEDDMNSGLSGNCRPYIDSSGNAQCSSSRSSNIGKVSGILENCSGSCSDSTPYRRYCNISRVSGASLGEQMKVTCTVEWESMAASGQTREVKVESYLSNWQEY
ncbi:MAG: type IV pilus modification PilV family protein [Patescibacteria group bacterium]